MVTSARHDYKMIDIKTGISERTQQRHIEDLIYWHNVLQSKRQYIISYHIRACYDMIFV